MLDRIFKSDSATTSSIGLTELGKQKAEERVGDERRDAQVLAVLHDGPMTRSEIVNATGLSRKSVDQIVSQMLEAHWAIEQGG